MSSSFVSNLINLRYPKNLTVDQAKRDAGFRVKEFKSKSSTFEDGVEEIADLRVVAKGEATTLKKGIKDIEIKLLKLETELFNRSEEYRELVKLENSWKRLQIKVDAIKINNNKYCQAKKKRRIVVDGNTSQEVVVEDIAAP